MWHVSSRSGVTICELLYTCYVLTYLFSCTVAERILLLAMLPAVSISKDDVSPSRTPDPESFPPCSVAVPPRPGLAEVSPWPSAPPRITRTAATPMATPQGSPLQNCTFSLRDTGPRPMRGFSDPLETTPQTMATVSRPESRCEFGCPPNCPFSRGEYGPPPIRGFWGPPETTPQKTATPQGSPPVTHGDLLVARSVRPSVCLSVCLSVCPSACLPLCLSFCLSACRSVCQSVVCHNREPYKNG